MRKVPIFIANILIIFFIMVFVSLYVRQQGKIQSAANTENFVNMSIGLERVTTYYLEGEQRLCNSWARYISPNRLTMNEAIDYLTQVQVVKTNSAHVIFLDSLTGLSNRARADNPGDNTVSYQNIDILSSLKNISSELQPEHRTYLYTDNFDAVHVTRSYTNPMNGVQSIAFCDVVNLTDSAGSLKKALLMRVVPLENISGKWSFPTERFENAQISMIDSDGNYIIKGKSFKNSNFFEFYKSYNSADFSRIEELKSRVHTVGSFKMKNSKGEDCLIVHVPVNSASDWSIISYIPTKYFEENEIDWILISVIAFGLLLLLIIDLIVFMRFNVKLTIAAAAAESANKAKTDFLSTMSHDIRTPMNAIIGLTTIAEKNARDPFSVTDNLKKIRLASNHLLTLINDILDISKVESGKLNLSPVTFSIVDSAENLVNLSQTMVREKNIDFRFRCKNIKHEYLYADQLRINQIFINILSNALKYTPEGNSVYVDMWEEESQRPGFIKLFYKVEDTGMGMSAEYMKEMYSPFTRQTDSRINKIQGTGLGLAITKRMVDLMGGTIECQSSEGKGTTFTVILELSISDRTEEEMNLPPLDVLVVDDDQVLLETASDTLTALGTKAELADSGNTALAKISEKKDKGRLYDVIILDWKMPGISGLELTRKIHEIAGKDIPILLVSAYDWTQIEDDARNAGVSGFISKPLFRSSLYKKISEVLGIEKDAADQEENNSELAGMNVLVAEDMDVNWEIIHTLLEMYGINSDRAENGKVAVEKLRDIGPAQYDVVFMDIQMPQLNGLDATRQIRLLENPYAAGIPIIAMTADAFSENVAECLEAGMNGHIAKPIDIKQVIKELKKIHESKPDFYKDE
ncbi:MAG: response regulator [Spirochaetales bacterium]|nr:response regulator [Spirochaetales bacterium]